MVRTKEDWVCEIIPGIWLSYDPVLMPNEPLMGKSNVWDALVKPKMYLEDKVRELCSSKKEWKDEISRFQASGFPKYYRACVMLEIRGL